MAARDPGDGFIIYDRNTFASGPLPVMIKRDSQRDDTSPRNSYDRKSIRSNGN